MITTIHEILINWNKKNNERVKLQHAYFALIIALVIIAGLVSLLNVETGRQLLIIGSVIGVVFVVNAVAWALLESFILRKVATKPRSTTKK